MPYKNIDKTIPLPYHTSPGRDGVAHSESVHLVRLPVDRNLPDPDAKGGGGFFKRCVRRHRYDPVRNSAVVRADVRKFGSGREIF